MTRSPRPRLKRLWFVLALFAGLGAALAAGVWASRPAWCASHPPRGTYLLGFSPDSREVVLVEGMVGAARNRQPRVVRRDAASGRLLAVVPLAWEGPVPPGWPPPTRVPGAERLLAGAVAAATAGTRIEYRVYDTATGRRTAGPFDTEFCVHSCSRDGRWCCAVGDGGAGLDVFFVPAGQRAVSLPAPVGAAFHDAAFAPDGGQVAVCWEERGEARGHFVRVYDLPGGHGGPRLDLPPRRWLAALHWANDGRLYAGAEEPAGPGEEVTRATYSFALTDVGLGSERAEPGAFDYVESGAGWVARLTHTAVGEPLWRRGLSWVATRLRRPLASMPTSTRVLITFTDPATGAMTAELPPVPYPFDVSPDGRRVAALGEDGRVEVWQADQLPPWLWSLTAGVLCGGLVLVVPLALGRRWRPEVAA